MYNLKFIKEKDFEKHVAQTISDYNQNLKSINLDMFNANIIDPIKLLFDKNVYQKSFKEILQLELHRQRDKSNTNTIGYFHQNIFKYIKYCTVPDMGWDVIYNDAKKIIFVEMKNKHNTMNSSAAQKTYIKMQNLVLKQPNDFCYLVETISKCSQNIPWVCSVDGERCKHEHIRRVSMDQFYKEVTGINDAFYQMCMQLPLTIEKLISQNAVAIVEKDTAIQELTRKNPDTLKALYLLAFETYEGFEQLNRK